MDDLVLSVPLELRRGGKLSDESASVESGRQLIQLMCSNLGVRDLGGSSVLDMGCGCKLVQAILNHDLRIGRYVGIDVFPQLINFLQANVTDARFEFHVQNTHNEMYNPQGEPLGAATRLPVEEESFDIICLFSVFTHLAPHDYVAMLKLLRRYIKTGGRILYSLYVNETTKTGLGHMDCFSRSLNEHVAQLSQVREKFVAQMKDHTVPDFWDFYPASPLQVAIYSRENALRLVQNTGWKVESLNDPEEEIQHYMICRPC
jgi:ubiquinone/menaquinone biosynthesis C-methylase UbiE